MKKLVFMTILMIGTFSFGSTGGDPVKGVKKDAAVGCCTVGGQRWCATQPGQGDPCIMARFLYCLGHHCVPAGGSGGSGSGGSGGGTCTGIKAGDCGCGGSNDLGNSNN